MIIRHLLAVFCVLCLATPALACSKFPQPILPIVTLALETPGGSLLLRTELAQTEEQRNCGLMGRPRLADGTGMLFDMRPAGPAHFWMKNTPEPLDILFLDPTGRVVYRALGAKPFSTDPVGTMQPVAAVLELAAGQADSLGVTLGTLAILPWQSP